MHPAFNACLRQFEKPKSIFIVYGAACRLQCNILIRYLAFFSSAKLEFKMQFGYLFVTRQLNKELLILREQIDNLYVTRNFRD
jgi:hypothetical protein